jgi:hypothetical protein
MSSAKKGGRQPRWATRVEAMAYARVGSTKMNEWLHGRRIFAKKLLNSIDDLITSAPDVADKAVA